MDGATKFVRGDAIAGLLIVGHQHHRRHHHRRGAEGHELRRRHADLHAADHRRRPGDADAGADRLHRRRPDGVQGRRRRLDRKGADGPTVLLSPGARHGRRRDGRSSRCCPACRRGVRAACRRAPARSPTVPTSARMRARRGAPPRSGEGRRPAHGRTDLDRAGARSAAHRTGLRPAAADQRCAGPPHHRPDQGAAPPAGAGNGLRHAGGAHPRQHAARRQRISHPRQGSGIPAGANLFPGKLLVMDPKGLPVDLPGTHTTEPAFGLPATWVDPAACARKRRSAATPWSIPARC